MSPMPLQSGQSMHSGSLYCRASHAVFAVRIEIRLVAHDCPFVVFGRGGVGPLPRPARIAFTATLEKVCG